MPVPDVPVPVPADVYQEMIAMTAIETLRVPRLLLAAAQSGSGKTTLFCGILRALLNKGLRAAAFKSGPDYIDPMFHTRVIGALPATWTFS